MTTEYKVNSGLISRIHILLGIVAKDTGMSAQEVKEYKVELVKEYTDHRESSTTKLSWKEAKDMIAGLEQRTGGSWTPEQIQADRRRKRILHYAHEMMWVLPSAKGRLKVDVQRVNGWCISHGYLHKPLNDYTLTELSKLVWQMQQAHEAFLNAV